MLLIFQSLLNQVASTPFVQAVNASTFASRLRALVPQAWFSQAASVALPNAQSTNGIFGAVTQGLGGGLATIQNQLVYAKNQTRLLTATDSNLDVASLDFFSFSWTRYPGETDAAFAQRIIARLLWPQPTLAGITLAAQAWQASLQYLPVQSPVGMETLGGMDTYGSLDNPAYQQSTTHGQLGADTFGAMDTAGGFDIAAVAYNPPTVYVFDAQSDPVTSALISPNITNPQFCVYFRYPGYPDSAIRPIGAYTAALAAIINAVKAEGTVPIFATNYV